MGRHEYYYYDKTYKGISVFPDGGKILLTLIYNNPSKSINYHSELKVENLIKCGEW